MIRRMMLFLAIVPAMAFFDTAGRAAVVEEIAAWVNGQIITRSELLAREAQVMSQLSARYVGDELDREVDRMRKNLLTDMIREIILMQRAEILGLELDKVYQQALTQLKEQQGIKTNEELNKLLESEGITQDELRETLLRFNVPDIMLNLEVREKISVTDEEVDEYYRDHKEEFRVEESFQMREIVLTAEGRTKEELAEAKEKLMADLESGMAFNELVIKYSQAPSRFNDGLIGPFKRGDLIKELEEALLALEEGEVSRPIETAAGVHILKLEGLTKAEDPDLEASRKKIVSRLKQEKYRTELKNYFQMLMETNLIEVNPVYRNYDQRT